MTISSALRPLGHPTDLSKIIANLNLGETAAVPIGLKDSPPRPPAIAALWNGDFSERQDKNDCAQQIAEAEMDALVAVQRAFLSLNKLNRTTFNDAASEISGLAKKAAADLRQLLDFMLERVAPMVQLEPEASSSSLKRQAPLTVRVGQSWTTRDGTKALRITKKLAGRFIVKDRLGDTKRYSSRELAGILRGGQYLLSRDDELRLQLKSILTPFLGASTDAALHLLERLIHRTW